MEDLTQRQVDILKAIIVEYSQSGNPAGSDILEKKYKLGVSPATIRNEMVELAKKGYLKKTHFSSGRVPSAKGLRFYIKHLMKEKELSTADEVAYKNSVWDERNQIHRLLTQATKILARRTGLLSLAVTDAGDVYYSGIGNLLNQPEFLDYKLSRLVCSRLDEIEYWEKIMNKAYQLNDDVLYLLGEEDITDPLYDSCASIFGEFETEKIKGIIGVVGSKRMYYEVITPQIKYFSTLIESLINKE